MVLLFLCHENTELFLTICSILKYSKGKEILISPLEQKVPYVKSP